MYEIRLHDAPEAFRIQLSGELAEDCVSEVALCWRTGSSTLRGRRLVIDLIGVASVDTAGRDLLEQMNRAGAEFIAASPEMRGLVREITGRPLAEPVAKRRRFPSWRRMLILLACPILRSPAERDAR